MLGVISTLLLDGLESKIDQRFSQHVIDAFYEINLFADIVTPLSKYVPLLIGEMIFMDPLGDCTDCVLPLNMKYFMFSILLLNGFNQL